MPQEKLNKISEVMGVSVHEILHGNRKGENVFARSICCYLLRQENLIRKKEFTLYKVAEMINLEYTTVQYHEKQVKMFIGMRDKKVCDILEKIKI